MMTAAVAVVPHNAVMTTYWLHDNTAKVPEKHSDLPKLNCASVIVMPVY